MKILAIILSALFTLNVYAEGFISTRSELRGIRSQPNALIVASTGRSGSTLLYTTLLSSANSYHVLKTHLLPPQGNFAGKILFIFSNPDVSAESALHLTLADHVFGASHFFHVETSDKKWLQQIGATSLQTEAYNLLAYDALGCSQQLEAWLHTQTVPSSLSPAQSSILLIKYKNLWDPETISAIEQFLGIDDLRLPPRQERGYALEQLDPREILFRSLYNQGTWEKPCYPAYDQARLLWENAPAFQFRNTTPAKRRG